MLPHRPAKKPRGENGAEALPIFPGPPSIDGVVWLVLWARAAGPPPVGSSGTGEEFSLASEDDFVSKEEEDDEEEDPTTAPPPRHISEPPDER